MEEFISLSVNLFTKFLSDSESIIKKNNTSSYLVSFALNYPASNLETKFDFLLKLHERSFYFVQQLQLQHNRVHGHVCMY